MNDKSEADRHGAGRWRSIGLACLLLLTAVSVLPLVGYYMALAPIVDALNSYADLVYLQGAERPLIERERVILQGVGSAFGRGTTIGQWTTPVIVFTALALLEWTYRAQRNLPRFGARELRFTPFWAVGWWFIPFSHFYRPFQVMSEIWTVSDPGAEEESRPAIVVGSAILRWWWGLVCFVLATIYARFLYWIILKHWIQIPVPLSVYFYLTAVFLLAFVAAATLSAVIVLEVDRRQSERFRQLAASRGGILRDAP